MMYLIIYPYFPSPKLFQTQTHFPTVSHFNMKALLFDSICNALCSVFYLAYHVFFKYTDEINFILIENVWAVGPWIWISWQNTHKQENLSLDTQNAQNSQYLEPNVRV